MNARVYDPTIGRFLSADDIIPDGSNGPARASANNRRIYRWASMARRRLDVPYRALDHSKAGVSSLQERLASDRSEDSFSSVKVAQRTLLGNLNHEGNTNLVS